MQAQFTARVLSYCLGKGKLTLKGRRQTPWLEITRSEIDRDYLGHQLWILRNLHDGPVDSVWDHIDSDGYYDNVRLRMHGEGLWRAYELLSPRDKPVISKEVLSVVGEEGIAALWLDQGRFVGGQKRGRGQIKGRYTPEEYDNITTWLCESGVPACVHHNHLEKPIEICIKKNGLLALFEIIRPLIHVSMKKKLRPAKK